MRLARSPLKLLVLAAILVLAGGGYVQAEGEGLNENDAKSFVYGWFGDFDRLADERVMAARLSPAIEMRRPDAALTGIAEFRAWYLSQRESLRHVAHRIDNLRVFRRPHGDGFDVLFESEGWRLGKNGQRVKLDLKENWRIEATPEGRLRIASCSAETK
jgi:hypothetical protein